MFWIILGITVFILWWMYPSIKGEFTFNVQNVNREVAVKLERRDKVQFWQKPGGTGLLLLLLDVFDRLLMKSTIREGSL